jgi:hypothetical protein
VTDYTITCERCGAGVPVGANTCPSCGAPVGASGYETRKVDAGWSEPEVIIPTGPEQPEYEPTIKVPEPAAPKSPPPEPVPPVFTPPLPPETPLHEAPKKSRVWQIVAGCVALTVICCCLVVVAGVVTALLMGGL